MRARPVEINTDRLQLGSLTVADAPLINTWKNDQEVQWLSADRTSVETLEQSERRVQRWMASDADDIVHFGIRTLAPLGSGSAGSVGYDERLIGFCHIAAIDTHHRNCHLGIVIGRKDLWGRGYAREACQALIDHCFATLNMNRIGAEAYSHNQRSIALLQRLGFIREGVLRQAVWKNDVFVDELLFGMLRTEWSAAQCR